MTRGREVNGWDMGAFRMTVFERANHCPPNTGQWRGQSARKILPLAASLAREVGVHEYWEPSASLCFVGVFAVARHLLNDLRSIGPRPSGVSRSSAMLFALGAASSV